MSNKLSLLSEHQLKHWRQIALRQTINGKVIDRILPLATANPNWFAAQIYSRVDESIASYSLGDVSCQFPLMSVIKPFLLLFLLTQVGREQVLQWVGVQPSEMAFNSLDQLIADRGFPRNPMINSGAITLADKLPGVSATERCALLCQWLNQQANAQLFLDHTMLAAVRQSNREANRALLKHLTQSGAVTNPDLALDTYEQICCLSGQVCDLAQLGLLLALEQPSISAQHRQIVNAVMLTCGLYEASGIYAARIGLPIKSGISGGLVVIVPRQGAIACYSPALDAIGNPVAGLAFVERLAQELQLSIFLG